MGESEPEMKDPSLGTEGTFSTLSSEHPVVSPEKRAPQASIPTVGEQTSPLHPHTNPTGLFSGPLARAGRSEMCEGKEDVEEEKDRLASDTYAREQACRTHEEAATKGSPSSSPSSPVRERRKSQMKDDDRNGKEICGEEEETQMSSPMKRLGKTTRTLCPPDEEETFETVTSGRCGLEENQQRPEDAQSGKERCVTPALVEDAVSDGESHEAPEKTPREGPCEVLFSSPELVTTATPCITPESTRMTRSKTRPLPKEKDKETTNKRNTQEESSKTLAPAKPGLTPRQGIEPFDTSKTEAREVASVAEKAPRSSPRLRHRSKTRRSTTTTTTITPGERASGRRASTEVSDASGQYTPSPTRRSRRCPANESASAKEGSSAASQSPLRERRSRRTNDEIDQDEDEEKWSSPTKRWRRLAAEESGGTFKFPQSTTRQQRKCRTDDTRNEDENED